MPCLALMRRPDAVRLRGAKQSVFSAQAEISINQSLSARKEDVLGDLRLREDDRGTHFPNKTLNRTALGLRHDDGGC